MMTCRELVELLIDFLSGELTPADCVRFRQHLEQCPPCVIYLETYQQVIQWTHRLPCRTLPPDVEQRLYMVLHQAARGEPPPHDGGASA